MAGRECGPPWDIQTARAEVRGRSLPRQAGRAVGDGTAFGLVDPQSSPRLWSRTARAVLDGFERGLTDVSPRDPTERLRAAVEEARRTLARFGSTLIERTSPDAYLVAIVREGPNLAGLVIGNGRVYRHRRGQAERISPREMPPEGLLHARTAPFRAEVSAGELIFAGTESAFAAPSIERSADVLEREADVAPTLLAGILAEPAEKAGEGAAAVAFRA